MSGPNNFQSHDIPKCKLIAIVVLGVLEEEKNQFSQLAPDFNFCLILQHYGTILHK